MRFPLRRRTLIAGAAAALATPLIVGRRASADDRSITVGIYTGQQGDVVRKQIIPPFEAKHSCKVYTTQGVTLEQIALMRSSRDNPKYSVMFVDDIGIELAKREGLIDPLPQDQLPSMEKVLKRFVFYDGYGAAFAVSAAGLAYNTATGKPLTSYGELWDARFKDRFLMETPKATQSIYLLIAAVSVETGKPYAETQHMIDQAWPKMTALKPNVLSVFENQTAVMQVAEGQADVAGIFYSKSVYPYTVQGAPLDMCYPREGTFAGINCAARGHLRRHQLRQPGQERAGARSRPRLYRLDAEPRHPATSRRADADRTVDRRPQLQARNREIHGLSRSEDGRDGHLQPRLDADQPDAAATDREVQPSLLGLIAVSASPATLRLAEVTKTFGEARAVDSVSLSIEPGSMVALLGPSGCGKTTILRMIAGLLEPSAGEIYLDADPITRVPVHRRNIGMLFQNYALFPHMNVAQNIAFGLETRGVGKAAIEARVADAVQLVQLAGLEERTPSELSGGQQQRVALARALVVEPALLLLDEPLGALDKSLRQSMQVELRALQRRLGITTVMVTHDQDEALTLSDRIVIMRDGRIEQIGAPEEVYQRPISRFTASFLGESNFFRGRVVGIAGSTVTVAVPHGPVLHVHTNREVASEATIALRPEAVTIAPAETAESDGSPNTTPAVVEQIIYRGFITHLYLRMPNDDPLVAFLQHGAQWEGMPVSPGMRVTARWTADAAQIVRETID
ncbi:MAG TPA: polyamine ABC transporter ATP-binding protein [Stellaceae bacterium]|nr:polyamine ABC transporter ATP-binding protein [Stellaceae bacterium]